MKSIKQSLLLKLSVIGLCIPIALFLYLVVAVLWNYDWTVQSLCSDFPFLENVFTRMHQNYAYMHKSEYLRAIGSPDGTREGLAEVYDFSAPIEQDAILPNNGVPHHTYYEVSVPEKGVSFRYHFSLTEEKMIPNQIVFTDNHFRFGWLDIGVGSPKWKVRLAYAIEPEYASYNVASRLITSHRLLPEERAEDFSLGYRIGYRDMTDDGIDVLFRFDENNRVDMMVLNFASGMP